jgi:hypothetical protein
MDCLQAREIVSEAFDRGVGSTANVEEARAHCRECAECRAFVEGLVSLQKAPRPKAPASVVDAVLERARLMAEHAEETPGTTAAVTTADQPGPEAREAAGVAQEATPPGAPTAIGWEPDIAARAPGRPREKWWWVPRASAIAGAAAVVVFAVVVSVQGFRALSGNQAAPESARTAATPGSRSDQGSQGIPQNGKGLTFGGAPGAPATDGAGGEAHGGYVPTTGATFVSFEDVAYVLLGDRTVDRGTLQLVGTLSSSLDTSASPAQRDVWRSSAFPGLIFLQPSNEGYVAFRPVERTYKGKRFVLTAQGLTGYGQLPALPSRFETPTASDGGPTFVPAGTDDTGMQVYAPAGASAEDGFAVAPGTSAGDPASGDPNWTWWVPKP